MGVRVSKTFIALIVLALVLAACSSSPAAFAAHGRLTASAGLMSGGPPSELFPDISDGGQVTVVNSSNTVIGTGTLHFRATRPRPWARPTPTPSP